MNSKVLFVLFVIIASTILSGCVDRPDTITETYPIISYDEKWNGNIVKYINDNGEIRSGFVSSDDKIIYSDRNEIVITYTGTYPIMDKKTAVLYINKSVMI